MKKFWQKLTAFKFTWAVALWNEAKAEWLKLTVLEQELSKQASGVIAIISQNMDASPDVIWLLVQVAFPMVTKSVVQGYLNQAATILKIVDGVAALSFEDVIKAFKSWVAPYFGDKWASLIQSAVSVVYTLIAPANTVVQKVINIASWIYTTFIKGKVVAA